MRHQYATVLSFYCRYPFWFNHECASKFVRRTYLLFNIHKPSKYRKYHTTFLSFCSSLTDVPVQSLSLSLLTGQSCLCLLYALSHFVKDLSGQPSDWPLGPAWMKPYWSWTVPGLNWLYFPPDCFSTLRTLRHTDLHLHWHLLTVLWVSSNSLNVRFLSSHANIVTITFTLGYICIQISDTEWGFAAFWLFPERGMSATSVLLLLCLLGLSVAIFMLNIE